MHPIFCTHLIIFLGLLNLDILTSTPPLECLHCLFVCNLKFKQISFFLFKPCIMIVHTLKMCTSNAGPEQSLVLLHMICQVECSNIILGMLQVLTFYLLVSFADNLCNSFDPQNVGPDLDSFLEKNLTLKKKTCKITQ